MADLAELHGIIRRMLAVAGSGASEELTARQPVVTDSPKLARDNTESTLDYYNQCLALLFRASQEVVPPGTVSAGFPVGDGTPRDPKATFRERVRRSRECWALLREARVFSFEPHVYLWLHHHADRYTTEVLAGLPYQLPGARRPVPPDETQKLVEVMFHHSKRVEFPTQWPFETIYVGFGSGVFVGEADFAERKHYYDNVLDEIGEHDTLLAAKTKGFLISAKNDGTVIEMADYTFRRPNGEISDALIPEWYRIHGSWSRSYSLVPWIVQQLCWLLNSYRKFVEEEKHSLASKFRAKDTIKKFSGKKESAVGWLPRPYYVVKMKPEVLEEISRSPSAGPAYRYAYRFDVRGHERVRVRRGWLPLQDKERKKLSDRGYKIYEGEIDDSDLKKLFARHLPPKRVNEWVAVLTTWVDSYQKGPEDAPYIPAVRIPAPGHEPS